MAGRCFVALGFLGAAYAQSAVGNANCPCLKKNTGILEHTHKLTACTKAWAVDGMCVTATPSTSAFPYPPTYGVGCGVHKEPGNVDCYNLTTELELPSPKDWCSSSWCYIDECDCKAPDKAPSVYFKVMLNGRETKPWYSYRTCDSEDLFTAEHTGGKKETTVCEGDANSAITSNVGWMPFIFALLCSVRIL